MLNLKGYHPVIIKENGQIAAGIRIIQLSFYTDDNKNSCVYDLAVSENKRKLNEMNTFCEFFNKLRFFFTKI